VGLQIIGQLEAAAIANHLSQSLQQTVFKAGCCAFSLKSVQCVCLALSLSPKKTLEIETWEAIRLPSQLDMAAVWPGKAVLRQTVPAIAFCDLRYLLDMFTETEYKEGNLGIQAKVQAYPEYGVVFKEIANRVGHTDPPTPLRRKM